MDCFTSKCEGLCFVPCNLCLNALPVFLWTVAEMRRRMSVFREATKGNVFCTKKAELRGLGRCVLPFFMFTAQNNFVFYVTEYWFIEFVNNAVGHLFKNVNE